MTDILSCPKCGGELGTNSAGDVLCRRCGFNLDQESRNFMQNEYGNYEGKKGIFKSLKDVIDIWKETHPKKTK